MDYRNQVVIVTGASSGIGWVTALDLARRGAIVVGVARREALLRKLEDQCAAVSPKSFHLAGDLGDRAFAEHVVAETVRRCGRLDVLVNNAAVSKHKHTYHTTASEAEDVMRINFLSCLWTTYAAIPHMLRQGDGVIVQVSSFAAKVPPPREGLYAASKAAMNAFSEGLWNDLAGSGLHVGIVHPGPIDTEIWDKEDEPPSYNGKKHPPEIVADAIREVIENRSPTNCSSARAVAPARASGSASRTEPAAPRDAPPDDACRDADRGLGRPAEGDEKSYRQTRDSLVGSAVGPASGRFRRGGSTCPDGSPRRRAPSFSFSFPCWSPPAATRVRRMAPGRPRPCSPTA